MKPTLLFTLVTALSMPFAAWAEDEAVGAAARPDGNDEALPSDGLAECAAMLAVASVRSKNFVERDGYMTASSEWFAASGDLASGEGALPEVETWETKIAAWSGKIGSVSALLLQSDWMAYCGALATAHGLDGALFAIRTDPGGAAEPAE